jgi:hypothetical protein
MSNRRGFHKWRGRFYDVGTEWSVHYLVSEFLEGQTLRERLNQGPVARHNQRRSRNTAPTIETRANRCDGLCCMDVPVLVPFRAFTAMNHSSTPWPGTWTLRTNSSGSPIVAVV